MADGIRKRRQATKKPEKKHGRKPDKEVRALERAAELIAKNPTYSKREALRAAGISDARALRRLAGKLAPPATKAKAKPPSRKAALSRQQPAAPLLARAPKKVGVVSKNDDAPKDATRAAPYQPKTDLPPFQKTSAPHRAVVPDVLAMARPWMALGVRMTATGLAMQARMAKAALDTPPAAIAMKQGTEALNAWLAFFRVQAPKKD
jgi:hypothetical protein